MKKQILFIIIIIGVNISMKSQNTFPENGNVGIGTSTLLDAKLNIKSSWGNWMSFIDQYNNDVYGFHNPNNGGRMELYIKDGITSNHKFGVFTILKSGNIGIGTTNPKSQLNIGTSTSNSPSTVAQFGSSKTNGEARVLSLVNSGGGTNQSTSLDFHNGPAWSPTGKIQVQQLGSDTKSKLHFYTYNSGLKNRMTINENGYVGIGTTNPDSELSVNGKIHTKEVKVDLIGWSDFVFYDNYNLPTLSEVEHHIKEKGHLKDIPSTKEVQKNGIYLGEMDSKLLQKIEELTLYIIAQEKKIKELESLNTKFIELQKRMEKLEKE